MSKPKLTTGPKGRTYKSGDMSPNTMHLFLDSGYTKVCVCGTTHGEDRRLIGKPRELEIAKCAPCFKRPEKSSEGLKFFFEGRLK